MIQTFKKLIYLLTPQERKKKNLLVLMILMMALLDMLGVASILPFMVVLTNPDMSETNEIIKYIFQIANNFGIETNQHFLFALGILVFVILTLSLSFKALTFYLQLRFVAMLEYSIGRRLVEGYLNQPYSWFLNRNSADLGKNILSEVAIVIGDGFAPMISLIAHSAVVVALLTLLFVSDPQLSFVICLILTLIYVIIYKFTQNLVKKLARDVSRLTNYAFLH